jgi:hypothetical protein
MYIALLLLMFLVGDKSKVNDIYHYREDVSGKLIEWELDFYSESSFALTKKELPNFRFSSALPKTVLIVYGTHCLNQNQVTIKQVIYSSDMSKELFNNTVYTVQGDSLVKSGKQLFNCLPEYFVAKSKD